MHCLIVGDTFTNRLLIKELLNEFCNNVKLLTELKRLDNLRFVLANNKVDVIFIDVDMRDDASYDILRSLLPIDAEIIFISSITFHDTKLMELGNFSFLLKPFRLSDFNKTLEKVQCRLESSKNIWQNEECNILCVSV